MALSDVAIRAAKPASTIRKLSDGGGLQLWITPAGGKIWKQAYRFNGAQKTLTIGPYPTFSLAEARAARDAAKRLLVSGADPAQQKALGKLSRASSDATTFGLVAREVREKKAREGKAPRTLEKLRWLHDFAEGPIGARPISDITAPEVLAVLRTVEGRGNHETAKRLRASMGEVFRYAIATGRASVDPTLALRGALTAPVVKHRAAVTTPAGLGGLLRAIEGFDGQPTTIAALKLMALLFPRPGELRAAQWSEFDLDKAVWTIPAARMKMRREHRVPLPTQAVIILAELHKLSGGGPLVFPGYGMSGGYDRKVAPRPISENTLNSALRRMGFSSDEMTAHGFRASASTLLNESGLFSPDAIERALAHQDADAVRRAYARGEHWAERLSMAQWWADQLDIWRDGANVIHGETANRV